MTDFGKKSWESQLIAATRAYNICFHRAINTSPFILKFGKEAKISILARTDKEYSIAELMQERDRKFETYKQCIEKGKKTVPYNLEI